MTDKEIEKIEAEDFSLVNDNSQPPLVVDLPDGQKLVVGNLESGTVIEVATWRGTGRPDSRTNRMMIGLSSEDQAQKEISAKSVPSIQNNSQSNEKIRTGINYADVNASQSREVVAVNDDNQKKNKSTIKTILKTSILLLILSSLLYLAIVPFGLRIIHPQSGAKTALGNSNTSLVVVKKEESYAIGSKVISKISIPNLSPSMAVVSAAGSGNYLLSTNKGYFQVVKKDIKGKVLVVLPFLGYIANLFN